MSKDNEIPVVRYLVHLTYTLTYTLLHRKKYKREKRKSVAIDFILYITRVIDRR